MDAGAHERRGWDYNYLQLGILILETLVLHIYIYIYITIYIGTFNPPPPSGILSGVCGGDRLDSGERGALG